MNTSILIKNGTIVNNGVIVKGDILVVNDRIEAIYEIGQDQELPNASLHIDATGKHIFPGVIDDQVHFRDPGLTHKGDIYTESKAALAGGVTSYFEMPNTKPQATNLDLLEEKYASAAEKSLANYSFYLGATNNNIDEITKADPKTICGLKVFMGSSTGNMLVDNLDSLNRIFSKSPLLIATHCEDESTIKKNSEEYRNKYGEDVPISCHPEIRSEKACYLSSSLAVDLAKKHGSRLHILHLSTAKELSLLSNAQATKDKKITGEICVHHLWFSIEDYKLHGSRIKWNPAIKQKTDRDALFSALLDNTLDVVATDHAPHTIEEKSGSYFKAASGGPLVQHALLAMLEFYHQQKISLPKVVEKMCHAPADIFKVEKRGYIKKGYFADLCIVDLNHGDVVTKDNILYKCGWSPFEGHRFNSKIYATIVNGHVAFLNGEFDESKKGRRISFQY